ncbi:MAG: hypothetical protein AB8B94_05935, partial [Hyphomicrobiales bacterium]
GSIQMIHTVSGLYMTSELGRVGTTMALGREAYTNLVRSWRNGEIVFEGADYELFLATDAVVSILNNPAQLQDFIERHGLQQASLAEVLRVVVLDSSVTPSGDLIPTNREHCFLGDTPIQMWPLDPSIKPRADGSYDEAFVLSKVWEKPISEIKVGDIVVAYDDKGRLGPKRVLRTMENRATHILDFWGTGTTPGHAYHCADGPNKGGHAPIMDILRMDGAIMRADGTMIRAATNCKVGSIGDMMIHASATLQKPDGSWTELKAGKVRFGTRIILPDDRHMSLMEMAASEGWRVSDDGYMVGMMKGEDGTPKEQKFLFPYAYGEELPKPEAYILARSAVTLEEIYAAGEWEQIGTRLPAPAGMVGLNTNHTSTLF